MRRTSYVSVLQSRGFDLSYAVPFEHAWRVRCSQCEAACINGVPCHETGCINEVHECHGCSATVPRGVKYCAECN